MIVPSHLFSLERLNHIWRRVHVMKRLIMQPYTTSCYRTQVRYKYSPLHPVLKYPQSTSIFLPWYHRPSLTFIRGTQTKYVVVYFNFIFCDNTLEDEVFWTE
jgi:hypothetical protein